MAVQRFGGEAAQILWRSLHWSSSFVGAVAVVLGGGLFLLLGRQAQTSAFLPPLLSCVAFSIVARIALDAVHSGEDGSLWRGQGAGPAALARALGRVVLANLCWLLPFALVLRRSAPVVGFEPQLAPLLIAGLLALMLPPVLLVIALGAESWPQLLTSQHWRRVLSGRLADLVQLYSSYLGATLGFGLLIWGAAIGIGSGHARLTLFLALVAGSYHIGVTLLLLGRLIGGFLRSPHAQADFAAAPPPPQPVSRDPQPRPAPRPSALESELRPQAVRPEAVARPESEADSLLLRLRTIEKMAAEDPGAALTQLVQLLHERGPHPLVLARMAMLEDQLGMPSAESVARDAVQLARQTGNAGALAELQIAFDDRCDQIGIGAADFQRIAGVHAAMGREDEAIGLYARVLSGEADPTSALKALLKLAEAHERQDRDLERALEIYSTILRLAPEHPFAEFAERGRAALERRLLRSV